MTDYISRRRFSQRSAICTVDVGINIGSFCAMYNTEHQNRIPQFMGENDFCSKGYKLRAEAWNRRANDV